jgi:hypothetical protein
MPVPYRIPVPLRGGGHYHIEALPNLIPRVDNDGSPSVNEPEDDSANRSPMIVVVRQTMHLLLCRTCSSLPTLSNTYR